MIEGQEAQHTSTGTKWGLYAQVVVVYTLLVAIVVVRLHHYWQGMSAGRHHPTLPTRVVPPVALGRSVGNQSQCTYARKRVTPRFVPLTELEIELANSSGKEDQGVKEM